MYPSVLFSWRVEWRYPPEEAHFRSCRNSRAFRRWNTGENGDQQRMLSENGIVSVMIRMERFLNFIAWTGPKNNNDTLVFSRAILSAFLFSTSAAVISSIFL